MRRCIFLSGSRAPRLSVRMGVFMNKTKKTVLCALLTAIVFLMGFTPIGYLRIGALSITFLSVPVIVGAILLGIGGGAFLGGIFGLTSFIQCFTGDVFGATLFSIDPLFTVILCFVPRILAGVGCAAIFKAMKGNARFVVASLCAPVLNTLFFTSTLWLLFGSTDYISQMNLGTNLLAFFAGLVGINGIIEAAVCTAAGSAVGTAIYKYAFPSRN